MTHANACDMKKKIDILREFIAAEAWHQALRLAASWPDASKEVRQAWEASVRPSFQVQLGRDPEVLKAAGIAALKQRFG